MSVTDLEDIRDLLLERLAGVGIDDMRDAGEDSRGSCPHCGKPDRFVIGPRRDGDGYRARCYAHCQQRDILDVLELSWRDLRLSDDVRERAEELHNPALVDAKPIEWPWQDRIPAGRVSLTIGNEGTGKGTLTAHLAARWTRGQLPGAFKGTPVNVLVVGSEDLLHDTWTPRLHLADADFTRVFFQAAGDFEVDFTDEGDIEHLRGWIRRYGIKVCVFDALLDHIGGAGVDEFKAKSVRNALRPLRHLAGEEEIAVIGSMHPRKGQVRTFRELCANSHQFNAISRSSLLLAPHPDDPMRRVLAHGKGNHAGQVPTLEFRVEVVHFKLNGYSFRDVRAVDWAETDVDLDQAVRASTGAPGDRTTKAESAEDAIVEALEGGWRRAVEVRAEVARRVGCSGATVERAAAGLREDAVLGSNDGGSKSTVWFLLSSTPSSSPSRGEGEDDGVVDGEPENPVDTGDSAAEPTTPSSLFSPSDGLDEEVGSRPNGRHAEANHRARAIELLRRAREQAE